MVGIIHTPRTLYAIGKGLARRQTAAGGGATTVSSGGIGEKNPFITQCRAGIFDCDYQLHMNNAAYLSHAEYARWELCAYNGLMHSMYHDGVAFMVGGTAIRFRREVRPVFRKFEVRSFVARLDERHLWIYHTFRYPPSSGDPGRIRAQMVCQGLAVQDRKILDPRVYLKDVVGMDAAVIDEISTTTTEDSSSGNNNIMADMMDKYAELEHVFREASAKDDDELTKNS